MTQSINWHVNNIMKTAMMSKFDQHYSKYETVDEYFNKFPHRASLKNIVYPDWIFQIEELEEWCKKECRGNFKIGCFRVNKNDNDKIDWTSRDERIILAFDNPQDHIMFILRWL